MARIRFRREIPIHVWGGLGSQLHAWYLYEYVRLRFPNKRFVLMFHSSGVTRRMCELGAVLQGISWIQVDDFTEQPAAPSLVESLTIPLRLVRNFLTRLGIVVAANTDDELKQIWVLTRSIRGHYSRLSIEPQVLVAMKQQATRAGCDFFEAPKVDTASIHIRLGDLVGLEGKSHTDFNRINSAIETLEAKFNRPKVIVFSDSPELVIENIEEEKKSLIEVNSKNTNAWDEMSQMINSQYFIGTASKLSTWVCVLRIWTNSTSVNYMPNEMAEILKDQLSYFGIPGGVQFY